MRRAYHLLPPGMTLALRFALADLWHDRRLTVLGTLLLAALLAPPVLLHTLRVGLVETWARDLAVDLRNREVVIVGEHDVDAALLQEVRSWPETGFVVPEPSFFVTTQTARLSDARGAAVPLDMRTTAAEDPVLDRAALAAPGRGEIVLSARAAMELDAVPGSAVGIVLQRTPRGGAVDRLEVILAVSGVLPEADWPGRTGLVTANTLQGFSRWLTFEADTPDTSLPEDMVRWQSLRIYAPAVADAPALRDRLESIGFETRLMTDQVDRILRLEAGLRQLFGLVLVLSSLAFVATTILLQWLSVLRKRRDFALMTVAGISLREMAAFPLVQGALVTAVAALLALGLALVLDGPVEAMVQGYLVNATQIVRPPLAPLFGGAFGAIALSSIAGAVAVARLGRLDVSRALRGD